ncbi:unnamed protein product [Heterobilharzia americana]|nr:unnamed protein product [Heterobilharzia americana]
MTLDSDKVEQRYWQTEENQHKTNLLFKSTIQKNRKEKLNISKTNPYSKLFLCQFFSVFILSIVSIKCTIVVRLEMNEEQQNATLVGLLIKYIPNHIIAKHKSLLFRPINKDHAYLFYVQPDDGRIYVAGRIDREKLCQYKDNSYHHRYQ